MPGSYVDNAYNRRIGRVGMPVGSMPVSRGSSGFSASSFPNTYVDNAYNRSQGRVGMEHGTAVISKGSSSSTSWSSSPKTYVDNSYNRSQGRVGMEHGTAVISKGSSSSTSWSSSPKTYVDNAYNRSQGRVGMEHGTAVISKGSSSSTSWSSSPKTYVDNAYNRSQGRVGMEHGTAVISKGSSSSTSWSSSPKTYVDNSYNRSQGRVGMEHATAVISKGSSSSTSRSSSPKTYVDNAYNRSQGRVGMEHGTAVISKGSSSSTSWSSSPKTYVDNAYNRSQGRVGMEHGTAVISKGSSSSTSWNSSPKTYVDNAYNRSQGRDEDVGLEYMQDSEYIEEASEQAADLINRMDQIRLWQKESQKRKQPMTSFDLLQSYRGERIEFKELGMSKKIGHGGFGDVFCAKWKGTVVAVKKLRVQRVSQKRLQEFTSEVTVFCTLDHPNIVEFIGACCVTPNIAIVMEFMEGCLFQMIHMPGDDDVSLTEDDKLSIIIQISRGLEYLHGKNIAHCDIKSQNVLMASRESCHIAKITDFGLGIMRTNSDTSSTTHDQVRNIGTPRYSAPEILRGELLDRTAMMRTDVYSLGLVVFEVISDDEPFDSLNAKQIERYVGNGDEKPTFGTDVDENLEEDVKECWSRDPLLRPSASTFRDSVEKCKTLW